MSQFNISILRTFGVVLLALALGCGGRQSGRQPVFGTVPGADGRPGVISFVPVEGNRSPAARCRIQADRYQFSADDGPLPGRYQVVIQLERDPELTPDGRVVAKEVAIPAEAAGEMSAQLETMPPLIAIVPDVDDGGTLQIDFQLTAQPATQ